MAFSLLPNPDATMTDPVPVASRRAFLAQLGALFTAGLVARSGLAAGGVEPPPLAAPVWASHPARGQSAHRTSAPGPREEAEPDVTNLNAAILHYLAGQYRAGHLARNERTAWLVYDFTSGRYLVSINANLAYQSASMIKPFIALAFFNKVREGKLQYTLYHRHRMEAMIQRSDNQATNYFIGLLNRTSARSGPAEAEHTLKQRHPGIFRQTRIVERIPSGGRSYRNRASATDYHRFLYALWYEQLPYSEELKRLMGLPKRNRLYTNANGVARQTRVLDKTGTTARLCGDMGIMIAQGRNGRSYPYTFIGIIEKSHPAGNYAAWKDSRGNVIRNVSSMVYRHMRQMYNLV